MIPSLFQPLANHLWQSTLFAGGAGLLTLALRSNRAQTRYWLWLAASVKFLVPFSILVEVGSHFPRHTAAAMAPSGVSYVIEQASRPFAAPSPLLAMPAPVQPAPADWIPAALGIIWAIGFAMLAASWWRRWRGLRASVRTASPTALFNDMEVRSSPAFAEPGVFGILRPVLLLPAGIADRLTPPQLEAILAHERCHARRRDNLAATMHMVVEALFWFHPLVWWLGARLMEERERACDEEVLLRGSDPEVYAQGILKVCELYLESPLPCVSGVTGANLKKRIEAIMSHRMAVRLNFARKLALAVAGAAAVAAPVVVGMLDAPAIQAQSPQVTAKFDVASVKACKEEDDRGGKRGGGGGVGWTPERLEVRCVTVDNLIRDAYLSYPEGKQWVAATRAEPTPEAFGVAYGHGCFFCGRGVAPVSLKLFQQPIQGSPAWAHTERYTIEAKAEAPTNPEMMRGPMMQALLADRFKLKIHRDSRVAPVYELRVAPGGPRLEKATETSCFTGPPPQSDRAPGKDPPRICGRGGVAQKGGAGYQSLGTTIAQLCQNLSGWLDRDVVDKTGITGVFDISLDAHRVDLPDLSAGPPADGAPPRPIEWDRAATFKLFQAALPKLGLKLEAAKGLEVYLVIDHVERPSGN